MNLNLQVFNPYELEVGHTATLKYKGIALTGKIIQIGEFYCKLKTLGSLAKIYRLRIHQIKDLDINNWKEHLRNEDIL